MSLFERPGARSPRPHVLRVAVLGCSGSIGMQTLDVCRQHADRLKVVALSVNSSCERLVEAACEFGATHLAVADASRKGDVALEEVPSGCELGVGPDAVMALAGRPDVDCVVNAVVGEAGMAAGYAALKADKILSYANKESIVVAGDLLMPLAKPGKLIPVDSEHSAIYQCLVGERDQDINRIWLTCSGGPFYGMTRSQLSRVTPGDALAHPTWTMGPKITIDCATLTNKGLEVIEAHHLFGVGIDDIHVLVQRQSRIHSMVEFADGSVKAQLGPSDMRIPIQFALSYPHRWPSPAQQIDFTQLHALEFFDPDLETFRCLALALEAGRTGGTLPCVLNAANEVAVARFLSGACTLTAIDACVEHAMEQMGSEKVESLEQLEQIDARTRALSHAFFED